jgi:hypothetical protein
MNINAYFLKGLFFGLLFDWEADDVRSELYLPVKESDTIAQRSVRRLVISRERCQILKK